MTALTWLFRFVLFVFLLVFAAQNTDPVTLRVLHGQIGQVPLIIVLLAFLAGGALLGVLSLLGRVIRQRREISRLKRELQARAPDTAPAEPPPTV